MSEENAFQYDGSADSGQQRFLGFLQRVLVTIFSLAFVAGGLFSGYVFVIRLKAFLEPSPVAAEVAAENEGNGFPVVLPEIIRGFLPTPIVATSTPITLTESLEPEATPVVTSKERVNILLLGIDQRPDEAGLPTRTDTMLIVTIDPASKTAGMISIPRDLWIPIPMDDRRVVDDRINTAHFWGDWNKYPGGGPALAKRTVQYNFGVKIHYYAKVDFAGFRRLVDALGGIDIDVPATLYDEAYPTDDYGYMTVHIAKGPQHLNGERALQYARSRHQDSDFGRMKRQQQVLLALRDRALRLDILPRLPQLILENRDLVKTDMPVQEAIALANAARDIPSDQIISRSIEGDALDPIRTSLGADIVLPVRKEIEKLVVEVFFDPQLKQENAVVEVLNGAKVPGLATQAAALLQRRGFKHLSTDFADDSKNYTGISLVDYTGKKYTVQRLAEIFSIPPQNIETRRGTTSTVDVDVIIGRGSRLPQ